MQIMSLSKQSPAPSQDIRLMQLLAAMSPEVRTAMMHDAYENVKQKNSVSLTSTDADKVFGENDDEPLSIMAAIEVWRTTIRELGGASNMQLASIHGKAPHVRTLDTRTGKMVTIAVLNDKKPRGKHWQLWEGALITHGDMTHVSAPCQSVFAPVQ